MKGKILASIVFAIIVFNIPQLQLSIPYVSPAQKAVILAPYILIGCFLIALAFMFSEKIF